MRSHLRRSRPITINLEPYTDGDAAFGLELASEMINSLRDFHRTVTMAVRSGDSELIEQARHKAKFTLSIINDPELMLLLECLKIGRDAVAYYVLFDEICDMVTTALEDYRTRGTAWGKAV